MRSKLLYILFFFIAATGLVQAASSTAILSVIPATGSYNVNDQIIVDTRLNTGGLAVTGVFIQLSFSANLSFISSSALNPNSIFPEEVIPPTSTDNLLTFSRVDLDNDFNGANGQIIRLVFKALSAGTATINFNQINSEVIASDFTNILLGVNNGSFDIEGPPPPPSGGGGGGGGGGSSYGSGPSATSSVPTYGSGQTTCSLFDLSSFTRTLKQGEKGSEVDRLILFLNYYYVSVGGYPGVRDNTLYLAIARYQKDNKLSVTGIFDTATMNFVNQELKNCAAKNIAPFSRVLRLGSKGDDVKTLQICLNKLKFQVAVSGPGSPNQETQYFGGLTKIALRKFQTMKNIVSSGDEQSTGYGQTGPKTRAILNDLCKKAFAT